MAGRKSSVLGIIGILLGASGLIYGIYSTIVLQAQINTVDTYGVSNTWYDAETSLESTSLTNFNTMPGLSLTVRINKGESLYVHFKGNVYIDSPGSGNYVEIAMVVLYANWLPYANCTSGDYTQVSTQRLFEPGYFSGAPNDYIIQVSWRVSSGVTAHVSHRSLLVQTII